MKPLEEPAELRFQLRHDRQAYLARINRCLEEIAAGETYEVCLTNEITSQVSVDPLDLYRILRRRNPAPYAAFLRFDTLSIASSSPERFLRIDRHGIAESKPIKGTARRDADPLRDAEIAETLRTDEKNRAENLMIVDLLRNDLGRVCETGSVHVPSLMHIESYRTVRFRLTLPVVDTFILPTQPLALVKRRDVETPRSIGLPRAALGYITPDDWDEIVFETTKPVVSEKLLAGAYDAGIAYIHTATENPDMVEIVQEIGEVVTTWILYGPRPRYRGRIIASLYPDLANAPRWDVV